MKHLRGFFAFKSTVSEKLNYASFPALSLVVETPFSGVAFSKIQKDFLRLFHLQNPLITLIDFQKEQIK